MQEEAIRGVIIVIENIVKLKFFFMRLSNSDSQFYIITAIIHAFGGWYLDSV